MANLAVKPNFKKILAIGFGVIIAILGLTFGVRTALTRAVDDVPRAVTVTNIKANSVTIQWETGAAVQSAVRYGTGSSETDLTSVAPETAPTKSHSIDLTLLEAGKTYYFKLVGASDNEYDNKGTAWTFTTAVNDGSSGVTLPTGSPQRSVSPIQHLIIPDGNTTVSTVNCTTETDCEKIKANFGKGCSTSDYVKCKAR